MKMAKACNDNPEELVSFTILIAFFILDLYSYPSLSI